jgi:alpha-amylase
MRCALVLHCGLPLGTPQLRLAQAVDGPLSAFLDALQTRPRLRFGLHLGGHVLDFLLRQRSERLVQLVGLTQNGQVELVGGGYYDPVLCSLNQRSAQAQLQRTHQFFDEQLRVAVHGAWLPEQVFEPSMVPLLASAGYRYCLLPCDPIDAAGLDTERLSGPLRLEQGGSKLLALAAARGEEQELVRRLDAWVQKADSGCNLLTWTGDLLALSPDPQSIPKRAQIERFLADLDGVAAFEFVTPLTASQSKPEALVYPGLGSHRAMGTWSLPVNAGRRRARILESAAKKGGREGLPLLAGGRWSAFLARYPEAGQMHTRALRLVSRIDEAELPSYWRERMWTSLLQAQGHEAFQHGDRSGIYNPVLRQAVHGRLRDLEDYLDHLEAAADGDPKKLNSIRRREQELLPDGTQSVVLSGTRGHWTVCPELGGTLVALELPGTPWDLVHTMGRYPEFYDDHGKNQGPKWSLSERFVAQAADALAANFSGDFSSLHYEQKPSEFDLSLHTQGPVAETAGVSVTKHFSLSHSGSEMQVKLMLAAPRHHALRGYLVETLYLSLPPGEGNKVRLADQTGSWDEPIRGESASIQFASPAARVQFSMIFPQVVEVITQPIYTEHRDRGAVRTSLQGIEIMALIPMQLSSGDQWQGDLILRAVRR